MFRLGRKISRRTSKFFWRNRTRIIIGTSIFLLFLGIFSYLTNPFTSYSIIDRNSILVKKQTEEFHIDFNKKLHLKDNLFHVTLARLKAGWHILINRLDPRIVTSGDNLDEIITNVHKERFGEEMPFLISGEHFSILYPRSLGIFYHSLLDPRTALNKSDWSNRQRIYLKTIGLTLAVYDDARNLSTTIVPVWRNTVSLINIYAPPSDTLYSILYGIEIMRESDDLEEIYTFENKPCDCDLDTQTASTELTTKFDESLRRHTKDYLTESYNSETGLVRRDIVLSSTKDSVRRSSAFYDNVIYWRTHELAQDLGIIEEDPEFLETMKQNIIDTFWLEEEGYFLEELSPEAVENKWYSSDWLIAYQTGFLDPDNEEDLKLLERSVQFVVDHNIDHPFGMRYQTDVRPQQLHRTVRFFAREYGSTAIWSHWGMEYIKLLTRLAQETGHEGYLVRAEYQLKEYKSNIERYGGFPEVYESGGDIFRTRFYRGIRSTGWIINYEQAVKMYDWTVQNWDQFAIIQL